MSISVQIRGAGADKLQQRLETALTRTRQPVALMKEVGRRGANELKKHFWGRDKVPNKLGGRRTHYWRGVANSVQNPVMAGTNSIVITVSDPTFAQKVFGGMIVPKNKKALTIPIDPLAYGRKKDVFERETGITLFVLRKKNGGGRSAGVLAGKVGDDIKVFYVLAKRADQQRDPDALPPDEQFNAALADQADKHLQRTV